MVALFRVRPVIARSPSLDPANWYCVPKIPAVRRQAISKRWRTLWLPISAVERLSRG
jgi:hypothetical protein